MPEDKKEPTHQISNILGGHSPTAYFKNEGQFLSSLGIDPDVTLSSAINRASGNITPMKYGKFSSTEVDSAPMWIMTSPKTELIYTYLSDIGAATNKGALVSYTSGFASETDIGTPTNGSGDGGAYYNNYLYLATPTDVSRYGPLDGSASLVNTFWSSTLGLTALTDTTYPSVQTITYPSHAMHAHTDGALYLCDFINGQGLIHKIITKKVTAEGDTDNGSSYNVLDLPFGYMPMDIESYGTDLVIAAMQTTSTTLIQGQAALFFWDTVEDSFYLQVPMSDPLVSALYNKNGELHAFSGNRNNGFRVSKYIGGYSLDEVGFFEEGYSPFAGAVDGYGNRLILGSATTEPATAATIYSFGYKSEKLPANARHSIARASAAGTGPIITSAKYVQQASGIVPRVVMGWKDGTGEGLDKFGSGSYNSVLRSELFTINKPFTIDEIRIPLSEAVSATTAIAVVIYYDDGGTTKTLNAINSTNYTGSEKIIVYKSQEIEEATTSAFQAQHDFFIELTMTGSDGNQIMLPIDIWTTEVDD